LIVYSVVINGCEKVGSCEGLDRFHSGGVSGAGQHPLLDELVITTGEERVPCLVGRYSTHKSLVGIG
jgi:hypothetical protein